MREEHELFSLFGKGLTYTRFEKASKHHLFLHR